LNIQGQLLAPVEDNLRILHNHGPGWEHFLENRNDFSEFFFTVNKFNGHGLTFGYGHPQAMGPAGFTAKAKALNPPKHHRPGQAVLKSFLNQCLIQRPVFVPTVFIKENPQYFAFSIHRHGTPPRRQTELLKKLTQV
jgi:hypothetical protein